MSSTQQKLLLTMLGCAAMVLGGCSAPSLWPVATVDSLAASPTGHNRATASDTQSRADSAAPSSLGATNQTASDAAAEPDLSGVIDQLQQIRQIDPTAEQKLLEVLRQTPAHSWPLVAEQFRASLAYREQLVFGERSAGAAILNGPAVSRPSARIGALTDPRGVESDGVPSEAFARSTPYSTPASKGAHPAIRPQEEASAAPAEFASDGPVYPIGAMPVAAQLSAAPQQSTKGHSTESRTEVLQASFNTLGQPTDSTGRPISAGAVHDWRQLAEMAADELSHLAPASPTTTAEVHQHITLRVLRLLTGDTEQALEPIPHISPIEQDYWSRQLFALAAYLDHHAQADGKRRAAASVTHLDEAVSSLRELGSLSVRNLSFCKNVYGYGAIDPYEADRFAPGEHVTLYVEVENYHSRSTEKGFCTSLGSTYEILSEDGKRVGGGEIPDVDDCCRSRRRDFHIQYGLTLPASLTPGRYRLILLIKDRQSDKIGQATVAFEIGGAGM
jgi:hypothetical protein